MILRRIYWPRKDRNGMWRIKTNDELKYLIRDKNIINYIKTHWFGHVQ